MPGHCGRSRSTTASHPEVGDLGDPPLRGRR
jgi:hypothetical protein